VAGQNFGFTYTDQAKTDLSSYQYHGIALNDGQLADNGYEACGIILNKPKNKEHVEIGAIGVFKYRAGLAVSSEGMHLQVAANGYFTPAASGYYFVGKALETVTSGSIGRGLFNFAQSIYMTTSDG